MLMDSNERMKLMSIREKLELMAEIRRINEERAKRHATAKQSKATA